MGGWPLKLCTGLNRNILCRLNEDIVLFSNIRTYPKATNIRNKMSSNASTRLEGTFKKFGFFANWIVGSVVIMWRFCFVVELILTDDNFIWGWEWARIVLPRPCKKKKWVLNERFRVEHCRLISKPLPILNLMVYQLGIRRLRQFFKDHSSIKYQTPRVLATWMGPTVR